METDYSGSSVPDYEDGLVFTNEPHLDPAKLILLYHFSQALAATTDTDVLLTTIVNEVRKVLQCEGAGVLMYDHEHEEFYWRKVRDKDRFLTVAGMAVRIPKDRGVCGWVLEHGRPALVNDALHDPRVYRTVDDVSGFLTKTMICVPLHGRSQFLGVLYSLNKINGLFTEEDVDILSALSGNVALALENAIFYEDLLKSNEELARLNKVKTKMLNHLSHELKTPLAVIEATMEIIEYRLEQGGIDASSLPFIRMRRNLDRLKNIQRQVGEILEDNAYPERSVIMSFLDQLTDLVDISGDKQPHLRQALAALRERIEEVFPPRESDTADVNISNVFQQAKKLCDEKVANRKIDIIFEEPDPVELRLPARVVSSILNGIIRNAAENTPDHGCIVITGKFAATGYRIAVADTGIGILPSERKNVFEGFYPLRETDFYSSGSQYAFNSGGTGTDLLKMKIYAERFGFRIGFTSERCSELPTARNVCPGSFEQCRACKTSQDCRSNGGTQFYVEIPGDLLKIPNN